MSSVLVVGLLALLVTPVLASGALVRSFDIPAFVKRASYFPLGVAFDGTNLWYSQPSFSEPGIFQISTNGILLRTLPLSDVNDIGALAWDGSNLWAASFNLSFTGAKVLEISVGPSPAVLKTISLDAIFAPDKECAVIDGLAFDSSTGSLWVSPDACKHGCDFGVAYNIDTSGNLIRRIQLPFFVSGVAVAGKTLFAAHRCSPLGFDQIDLKGNVISSFPMIQVEGTFQWPESLSFDPVSFTPTCSLWAMQPYQFDAHVVFDAATLVAYHVDCPGP